MTDAVIIKTRKFKRNPLLARKQVCDLTTFAPLGLAFAAGMDDDAVRDGSVEKEWCMMRPLIDSQPKLKNCVDLIALYDNKNRHEKFVFLTFIFFCFVLLLFP